MRLGRESPLGAGGEAGPALRDPASSSAAARSLYSNPAYHQAGHGLAAALADDRDRRAGGLRPSRGRRPEPDRRGLGGRDLCRHPDRSSTSGRRASKTRSPLMEGRGPDARVIAGGHSLLPMMKLRLANPEPLIDLNDLEGQLSYIREQDGQVRIGALTRHLPAARVRPAGRVLPDLRRRRARDRRPGRAQPRHDRRLARARPTPPRTCRAVCTALKAEAVIQGSGGERVVGDGRLPRRPVHDRGRRRRGAHRDPASRCARGAAAPTRRSSGGPGTGRSSPRRRGLARRREIADAGLRSAPSG